MYLVDFFEDGGNDFIKLFSTYEKAKDYCIRQYEHYLKDPDPELSHPSLEEAIANFDRFKGIDCFVSINFIPIDDETDEYE